MEVQHKDATITPTGSDTDFPGTFEVVLSAPTKDRDGDTLLPDEWKQPLPDHITFDADHGMTVATTVGSGIPRIDDETGNLVVSGAYSSLARAQDVRTLVNEGHIRTTSVAFMSEKTEKDGKTKAVRELLNGAFVAIPSNREALVLSSKTAKAGARNSASDASVLQAMHDSTVSLGASCVGAPGKSVKTPDDARTPDVQTAEAVADSTTPDEDDSATPAAVDAAAPAEQAAAPAETPAAADEELQTRVRAFTMSASTYTD